jgi:hypothetical protein
MQIRDHKAHTTFGEWVVLALVLVGTVLFTTRAHGAPDAFASAEAVVPATSHALQAP